MRRVAGWAVLGIGLILVAVVALQLGQEGHHTRQAQEELLTQIPDTSLTDPDKEAAGVPVARSVGRGAAFVEMRIPRFGDDWRWAAVEGTSAESLANGPGHYAGTALPGQRGNCAFAGHRAGHGNPFIDFDRLRPGDVVTLRQGRVTWEYRLTTEPRIIPPSSVWVLRPLRRRVLTLTTCWPKYGSEMRMFVRAQLAKVVLADRTVYTHHVLG